mgnify:FL=1
MENKNNSIKKTCINNKIKSKKISKSNKREKGITLVSLVVTVVVLMFLAGVIIVTNNENNGVLNIANSKKEETERMTIEETIKTELTEDPPDSYAQLIEYLRSYGEIQNEEVPDEAMLITTNGNHRIYVKDIWNVDKQEINTNEANENIAQ